MDFNTLIEFGILKRKPDKRTDYAKKQEHLGLIIENTDSEAESKQGSHVQEGYPPICVPNVGHMLLSEIDWCSASAFHGHFNA